MTALPYAMWGAFLGWMLWLQIDAAAWVSGLTVGAW